MKGGDYMISLAFTIASLKVVIVILLM